ncbi:bifunctional hydroxymethylpyrimidine kinase/phosphomethylpyrimidine kinase [Oceanisphaera pacifica]|uniref:hydroxymethylpyrimidine kinase n=1 Tax=Oceanisphaera pacifica TaxID=2818389 RepID=A0ABS3NJN7_9GAMM|nr:bifunctional hydroxymethylpyrimidine kinase/phosphomethylpyrimidine kinase [Oceanisphaera pacifica]MBO1520532.1 bifunctional hydroxymethylpyrimidine kinase/phosphomethylpyrimidine kinase [Oceanisphaera pacifica]
MPHHIVKAQAVTERYVNKQKPVVLTIAGSDCSGGAGIQADIKAISATGGYACSVITALTAQNTQGVSAVHPTPQAMIEAQLDAIFSDLAVTAVKVGMLGDSETIGTVASALRKYKPAHLVVDPVMVTANGDMLLVEDAVQCLREELLPLADVITPNLPEAAALLGATLPQKMTDVESLFSGLGQLDCGAVLLKGGFLQQEDRSPDWLLNGDQVRCFDTPRIMTPNTHGTGCTLSAALASYLGQGFTMSDATERAKRYIDQAILAGSRVRIGQGRGPVEHFFAL